MNEGGREGRSAQTCSTSSDVCWSQPSHDLARLDPWVADTMLPKERPVKVSHLAGSNSVAPSSPLPLPTSPPRPGAHAYPHILPSSFSLNSPPLTPPSSCKHKGGSGSSEFVHASLLMTARPVFSPSAPTRVSRSLPTSSSLSPPPPRSSLSPSGPPSSPRPSRARTSRRSFPTSDPEPEEVSLSVLSVQPASLSSS